MGHDKLENVFKTNFSLMQHHHWSISELESMMPWERYVYIDLLQMFLKEEEQRQRDMAAAMKSSQSSARRR